MLEGKEVKIKQVLYNRVLVKRAKKETKTAGGIIIPDSIQEDTTEGVVILVGKGLINKKGEVVPCDIQEGDKVTFSQFSGLDLKDDMVLLKEDDILFITE